MKYTAPEMEIVMFETEEVIVASAGNITTSTTERPVIPGDGD